MLAASIENFDFAVQRIPSIKALSIVASPASFAIDRSEKLEVVEYRWLRYRLWHVVEAFSLLGLPGEPQTEIDRLAQRRFRGTLSTAAHELTASEEVAHFIMALSPLDWPAAMLERSGNLHSLRASREALYETRTGVM